MAGTVMHLQLSGAEGKSSAEQAMALKDRGLEGDKYARPGRRQVLLVEEEVLDEFLLAPERTGRGGFPKWVQKVAARVPLCATFQRALSEQITVAGMVLSSLPTGARIRAGSILLEVVGPCEPCHKMNRHGPGMRELLQGKRGILARVLEGGLVRVGDEVCAST